MLARCLRNVGRLDGIPLVEDGRLWLVSRRVGRPADPRALAELLLRPEGFGARELAASLGTGAPYAAHRESLAHRAMEVRTLESARDLERLRREGRRPLRPFHGEDLAARVAAARQHLDRLSVLLRALEAAVACQGPGEEPPPRALAAALPLRLYGLGVWSADPARLLLDPRRRADSPLLEMASRHRGDAVGVLAALLLGQRHRRSPPVQQGRVQARLPAPLEATFRAALGPLSLSPCLTALSRGRSTRPLEGWETLSRREKEPLMASTEPMAALYGPEDAQCVLADLSAPGRLRGATLTAGLDHARAFVQQVEAWECGGAVPDDAVGVEARDLDRLPDRPASARGRGLARLFCAWMEGAPCLRPGLGPNALARVATGALAGGLGRAAAALSDRWEARQQDAQAPSKEDLRVRLAASLCLAGTGQELPARVTRDWQEALVAATAGLPAERLAGLASGLLAQDTAAGLKAAETLTRGSLPRPLVHRALTAGVAQEAARFAGKGRALGRFLDFWEAARRGGLEPDLLRRLQVHMFFLKDALGTPQIALTLMSRLRGGAGRVEVVTSLEALGRALKAPDNVIARALVRWHTVVVERRPDQARALARALDVSLARLETYLHHRRLNGHGETFSRRLLAPLAQAQSEQRQVRHLQRALADPNLDRRREAFARRLEGLQDPARRAGRRAAAARRAQRRLERDLANLEYRSLEIVMNRAARRLMEEVLQRPLPKGPVHPELWKVLQLFAGDDFRPERKLVLALLEQIATGAPSTARPPNRDWMDRAAAAGVDVAAWTRGFSATVEVGGEPIRFATEHDPVEALKMGSYFSTCLSLEDGFNRASAVINTLDVNKQVVYGRREDGAVVVRKLIGATAEGALAGYCTYALGGLEVGAALAEPLLEFGSRCGLSPGNTATPEVLHGSRWYDDGNEAWPGVKTKAGSRSEDVRMRLERHTRDASITGDWQSMPAPMPVFFPSLVYHRTARCPELYASDINYLCDENIIYKLVQRGEFDWLPHTFQYSKPPLCLRYDGNVLLTSVPLRLPSISATVAAIRRYCGRSPCQDCEDHDLKCGLQAHACLSMLPVSEVAGVIRDISGEPEMADSIHSWALCLLVAYLRDRDPGPLRRALSRGPSALCDVVLVLASKLEIPGLAPHLRQLLRRCRPEDQLPVALALGSHRKARDAPRLLKVLRQNPTSRELLARLVRLGSPGEAGEALDLIYPDPLHVLHSSAEHERVRDMAVLELDHRILQQVRRAADQKELTPEMIKALAGMALPHSRAELDALLDQVYPISGSRDWTYEKRKKRRALTDRWVDARNKRAAAGQRELLLVRAAGDRGVEGAEAFRAWLGDRPGAATYLLGYCRDRFGTLSDHFRASIAQELLEQDDGVSDDDGWGLDTLGRARWQEVLAWMEACSPDDMVALSHQAPERISTEVVVQLETIASEPRRQLIEALLAGARDTWTFLVNVDDLLLWVHPSVSEPLARCLLMDRTARDWELRARVEQPGEQDAAIILQAKDELEAEGWGADALGRYLCCSTASYRLQRMLVDLVLPWLDDDDLGEIRRGLQDTASERSAWVLGLMEER